MLTMSLMAVVKMLLRAQPILIPMMLLKRSNRRVILLRSHGQDFEAAMLRLRARKRGTHVICGHYRQKVMMSELRC